MRRSTQKCLRYQSTKLEFIVGSETIFQNCWSISRRKTDQLDQNKNYDNLVSFCSPNISLSNSENRRFLAASVREILKKYRGAFFFGADKFVLSTQRARQVNVSKKIKLTPRVLSRQPFHTAPITQGRIGVGEGQRHRPLRDNLWRQVTNKINCQETVPVPIHPTD